MCSTGLGHEDCITQFKVQEQEVRVADADSWRRSSNKVYLRKIAKQQGVAGYSRIKRK